MLTLLFCRRDCRRQR